MRIFFVLQGIYYVSDQIYLNIKQSAKQTKKEKEDNVETIAIVFGYTYNNYCGLDGLM